MGKKTICLSAGHQPGYDPGACSGGLEEAELNVKIVEKTARIIRSHGVGCLVVPDNLNLPQVVGWVNDRADQIDVAVEVHVNAGGGTGVEAWHYTKSEPSKKLAQFLADAMAVETGLKNRGAKDEKDCRFGYLYFVHNTKPLAALAECGFIDNDKDRELLKTNEGLEMFAKGVARGILGYIGVDWKPPTSNNGSDVPTNPCEELKKELNKLKESVGKAVNELKQWL